MRVKYKMLKKSLVCMIAMLAVVFGFSSCDDDFTTDNSGFALYYTSITDIGPSMHCVIASPTYNGATPYDFAITGMKYAVSTEAGSETFEAYTGECFSINAENGEISVNSTRDMKVGKYFISVSCYAAGSKYTFNDAVEVNFLKAVPEGIVVEPKLLEAKLADVTKKSSEAQLPTAHVTTENASEHITIMGYKISNVVRIESDDSEVIINNDKINLFSVSDAGVISINKSNDYDPEEVKAGMYRIDMKLVTAASPTLGEEEGLFHNALNVNLTAAPTSISYKKGVVETGIAGDANKPKGSFTSSKPFIEGSYKDAVYEITSVKKSTDGQAAFAEASAEEKAFFLIDAATGVISVPDTHTFEKGNVFKVAVKVSNPYGEYTCEDALMLNVTDWVDPLTDFSYPEKDMKQGMGYVSDAPQAGSSENSYLEYSFVNLPEEYKDFFSINKATGVVTVEKYNTLPVGKIEVDVKAEDFKSSAIGKLAINVVENPNYFTYISYGNNLVEDQTPGTVYDNQFRFFSMKDVNSMNLVPKTDAKEGQTVKWTVSGKHQYQYSPKEGAKRPFILWDENACITAKMQEQEDWKPADITLTVLLVTATVGEGEDAFSRTCPLFINYVKPINGVTVQYTPFVLHINPKAGGRSVAPTIENGEKFLMDYRRTFNYYNINGVDSEGKDLKTGTAAKGTLLGNLWESVGKSTNYGAKLPMSYYDKTGKTKKSLNALNTETLAYVDNASGDTQYSVVVNPVWYDDGWADGIVTGQMTFVTNGDPSGISGSANRIFPIAIWLDKSLPIEK